MIHGQESDENRGVYRHLKGCTVDFVMFDQDDPGHYIRFKHVICDRGWHGVQNRAAVELATKCGSVYGDVLLAEAYGIEPRIMLMAHLDEDDSRSGLDTYADHMFNNLHQVPPSDQYDPDEGAKVAHAKRVRERIVAAFEDEPAGKRQRRDGPSDGEPSNGVPSDDAPSDDAPSEETTP